MTYTMKSQPGGYDIYRGEEYVPAVEVVKRLNENGRTKMHPDRAIARSDARTDALAGTKRNRYKYNSREWRAYEAMYVTTRYNVSRAEVGV